MSEVAWTALETVHCTRIYMSKEISSVLSTRAAQTSHQLPRPFPLAFPLPRPSPLPLFPLLSPLAPPYLGPLVPALRTHSAIHAFVEGKAGCAAPMCLK